MYWEIDRGFVEFDKFDGYEKAAEKFKKSLYIFDTSSGPKDSFHNTILFGLVFKLFKNSIINKETIEKLLGNEFFDDFQQKKKNLLQLDLSFCNFLKKCYVVNEILTKKKKKTFYESKFNGHVKCCSDIVGIICKSEHKNVVSFQDNFSYLGDLPFVIYFDYETTTGDSVFKDKNIFVTSYCQIYEFHPDLINLDKIIN